MKAKQKETKNYKVCTSQFHRLKMVFKLSSWLLARLDCRSRPLPPRIVFIATKTEQNKLIFDFLPVAHNLDFLSSTPWNETIWRPKRASNSKDFYEFFSIKRPSSLCWMEAEMTTISPQNIHMWTLFSSIELTIKISLAKRRRECSDNDLILFHWDGFFGSRSHPYVICSNFTEKNNIVSYWRFGRGRGSWKVKKSEREAQLLWDFRLIESTRSTNEIWNLSILIWALSLTLPSSCSPPLRHTSGN